MRINMACSSALWCNVAFSSSSAISRTPRSSPSSMILSLSYSLSIYLSLSLSLSLSILYSISFCVQAAGPSLSYAAVGPAVRASTAPIAHNLRVSGVTGTSVTISWDPPSSPVEAWLFSYRPVGSGAAPTIAEVSGTLSDETFTDLTQDTAYTFTVRARSLAGEGDAIETIGVPTAAPTSPATLVVLSEVNFNTLGLWCKHSSHSLGFLVMPACKFLILLAMIPNNFGVHSS